MLSSENKQKARMPLLSLVLFIMVLKLLNSTRRQEKDMQIRKEEIKLSLFADVILSK